MLPYAMDLLPGIGRGRWAYWLATWLRAGLVDDPIPPVDWKEAPSAPVRKMLERATTEIGHRHGFGLSAAHRLVEWLAWALAVSNDRPALHVEVEEALYRGAFCLDPLLECPCDAFGWLFSEGKGRGTDPSGFYPTPLHLCKAISLMSMPEGEDLRAATVMDPCVGTGNFLLVAGDRSLRLYGMDINPHCCLATKINGALYVPWLSFPFPESFFTVATPSASLQEHSQERPKPGVQLALFGLDPHEP